MNRIIRTKCLREMGRAIVCYELDGVIVWKYSYQTDVSYQLDRVMGRNCFCEMDRVM
jgi:hypothetical protein